MKTKTKYAAVHNMRKPGDTLTLDPSDLHDTPLCYYSRDASYRSSRVASVAGNAKGGGMRSYHFTGPKLRNGKPLPKIGEWLEHEGIISPCSSGLHASAHPFDALQYAPGPILHLVDLEGDLVSHGSPVEKWVGRRRRIIASVNATEILWYAARQYALSVAHLWDASDVALEFLFTGDENLRDAAWTASWNAAEDAAGAAGGAAWAARSAAGAAGDAAWAAWAAAWAAWAARAARAARADAGAAAFEENRQLFKSLVDAEFSEYLP